MQNNNKKIWLSPPHMGGGEMKYIEQAFQSNWISPFGPNIEAFEQDLENYLGEEVQVTAVSSGTAALHLALRILEVEKDDFVICQSLTFVASANPILYMGGIPVFVDSEKETWNLCPQALEDAIKCCISKGKLPKAIIAVCLYGMPYKVDEITTVADKYGIPIIEDSAEALGSCYKGRKCGTFGDLSIISFNGNKIITTSGGGALVTKNKVYKEKAVFLANQAKDPADFYEHSEMGYNYRMSNICAGIGRGQMEVLEKRIFQKKENHFFYRECFSKFVGIGILNNPDTDYDSNHWLTVITVDDHCCESNNKSIRKALWEEYIEARPLWKPMHKQPLFHKTLYFGRDISENLFKKGLCLPSGTDLTKNDRRRINEVVTNILEKTNYNEVRC